MKIGLIFPNKDRRYKTIHLGLGYIASFARSRHFNIEFQILDTRVATSNETNAFYNTSFDIVGITVFSPVFQEVKHVFKKIKSFNKDTPVCLGGPYVTTIMTEVFEDIPAEFGVYGEGEETFSELIDFLKGKGDIDDIKGLMFLESDGNYKTNPPRDQILDLDSIPMPAYDLFKMDRYPLHRVVTSRGCPYSCSFCNSSSIWLGKWRKRNAKHVFDEIDFLVTKYEKKNFGFNDNSFNIDKKHVGELCDLLIENKTNILWSTPVRVENIDQPLANKMKEAGCYNISVGIESANNYILSKINKLVTIEEITEGIRIFKKAGIEIMGQFVIGSPYETLENVKESIYYAKKSDLDYVNFYTVLPFKGTPQWNYVLNEGMFLNNKTHNYHTINPRIVFETKEFPYSQRLEALSLVKKEGYNSNKDKRSYLFDLAKDFSATMQKYLPTSLSKRIYMLLKSIYKINLVKKNNI